MTFLLLLNDVLDGASRRGEDDEESSASTSKAVTPLATIEEDLREIKRKFREIHEENEEGKIKENLEILSEIQDIFKDFQKEEILENQWNLYYSILTSIVLKNADLLDLPSTIMPSSKVSVTESNKESAASDYVMAFTLFLLNEVPLIDYMLALECPRSEYDCLRMNVNYDHVLEALPESNLENDDSKDMDVDGDHGGDLMKLACIIRDSGIFDIQEDLDHYPTLHDNISAWMEKMESTITSLFPSLFTPKPSIDLGGGGDMAVKILDLYFTCYFHFTPLLDLSFLKKCDAILFLESSTPLLKPLCDTIRGMKSYVVQESISCQSIYRHLDEMIRVSDILSFQPQALQSTRQITGKNSSEVLLSRPVLKLDTQASLYATSAQLFALFVETFQISEGGGGGGKRKKRKSDDDSDVVTTSFVRLEFSGKEVEVSQQESVDISLRIDDDEIVEVVKDVEAVNADTGQPVSMIEVEESAQTVESTTSGPKKRKKFEKMRSSVRLKQDEGAAPAPPDANTPDGGGAIKIEDLSFISDYLPADLLSGYNVVITPSSLEMTPEEEVSGSSDTSLAGLDCKLLLDRLEKDIMSTAPFKSSTGSKRGRPAKGTTSGGDGGDKAVILDQIFPDSDSLSSDTAASAFFKNGTTGLVPSFEEYLQRQHLQGEYYSQPHLGFLFLLFVIKEYASTLDTSFWTPQLSKITVLWVQCLWKFGGIRLDQIILHEVEDRLSGKQSDQFIFTGLKETLDCLLLLCEVLLDSLTDRNGSVSMDIYDEIATVSPSISLSDVVVAGGKNSLQSTCKKSAFDAYYAVLVTVLDNIGEENSEQDRVIKMRALWISARSCELGGDAVGAVDALRACTLYFDEQNFQHDICIPHYLRDGVISKVCIQDKIDYFELKVQIEETEYFFNNGNLDLVVDRLEPLFLAASLQQKNRATPIHSRGREIVRQMPPERRLTFLKLLRESSFRLGRFATWLSTVVECIAVTVGTMETGVLDICENIENLSTFLLDLQRFIEDHSHWRSFIQNMHDFTFLVLLSLHISWKLVMCVKSLPKTPKTAYSRKVALIKSFVARAWILFYHMVVDKYDENNEDESDCLPGILEWVHDQLGSVELCGGDDGGFLKLVVHALSKAGPDYYHEIYQCYSCLYGTVIKIGSNQELVDHQCAKTDFGKEAAEILYKFISPLLLEKVEASQFRAITKDMVDCLTKVLDVFSSPPMEDRYVAMNAAALDRLLKSQIIPRVALPDQRQALAMVEIPDSHVSYSPICKTIFYLFGRIQLNNFLTKPDKAAEFLASATQNLVYHVLLSPNDLYGWVALATAYSSTANEILGRTLIEYREKRRVIDAQRAGFHCYVRALKLYAQETVSEETNLQFASILWNNFAHHCQAIISSPMEGVALKNDSIVKIFEMAGETKPSFKESEYISATSKQLHVLNTISLKKAIQIDPSVWTFYLSLAHTYRKLKKDPMEVISLYLRGIHLMPSENITKDQDLILDPIYKCISFVIKVNYDSILSEGAALKAFKDLKELYPPLEENVAKISSKDSTDEAILLPQNDVLREGVLLLHAIKRIDKKKWYHRPSYRIAWVWAVVEKEHEPAKEELSLLLNIKTKLRRIWKTDLEADGRHYVYFTRYITMLIELAQKTGDIPLLIILCKRLLVEENIISKVQVRNDARKALLSCLTSLQGHSSDHSFKKLLESVSVIDPDVEKLISSKYESIESNEVHRLVIACDLKRARKQSEAALERFILNVYSKHYLDALGSQPASKKIQISAEKETKMAGKILLRAMHFTKSIGSKSAGALVATAGTGTGASDAILID